MNFETAYRCMQKRKGRGGTRIRCAGLCRSRESILRTKPQLEFLSSVVSQVFCRMNGMR
jgi:hypothetical protein